MYPEIMVIPMREELTRMGIEELRSAAEVDRFVQTESGTTMLIVNSICGCAAGRMRPAVRMALQNATKPGKIATVFAGRPGLHVIHVEMRRATAQENHDDRLLPFAAGRRGAQSQHVSQGQTTDGQSADSDSAPRVGADRGPADYDSSKVSDAGHKSIFAQPR